jgi:ERCC4-type nuclease
MIIIQDSREQNFLDFSGIEGVEKVEVSGLAYGDYAGIIHGKLCPIIWERKSFSDLWGTMSTTDGHRLHKIKILKAQKDNVKLILIIEGTYSEVWSGFERSAYDGASMLKKLATLYVKYDHEYVFCESRRVMARRIADTFLAIERGFSLQTVGLTSTMGLL